MPDLLDTVARALGYATMFCVAVGVLAIVGNAAVERIVSGRRPKPEPEVRGCAGIIDATIEPDAWTGPGNYSVNFGSGGDPAAHGNVVNLGWEGASPRTTGTAGRDESRHMTEGLPATDMVDLNEWRKRGNA